MLEGEFTYRLRRHVAGPTSRERALVYKSVPFATDPSSSLPPNRLPDPNFAIPMASQDIDMLDISIQTGLPSITISGLNYLQYDNDLPKELTFDLLRTMAEGRDAGHWYDVSLVNRCNYHHHDNGGLCCS